MARKLASLLILGVGFGLLTGSTPAAGGSAVKLVPEVAVNSGSIGLSDLLPPEAPEALREAANGITLGRAPELGTVRQITRAEIETALADHSQILAEIVSPDRITIRRACHPISSQQIAAAIAAAVGPENADGLSLSGSLLGGPVYFSGDDPGLQVTEIDFDPFHRLTRFKIWTSKEPENITFCVAVPGRLKTSVALSSQDDASRASRQVPETAVPASSGMALGVTGTSHRVQPAEELIKTGVAAQLVIEGPDYRITSTVIPLQAGVLGEQIRARDPLTQKLLNVQVAGPGVVRGSL
jgi:hypothetical protein